MPPNPRLSSENPRQELFAALKASPVGSAWRIGKAHPDQVGYWLMVYGPDIRLNREFTFISVYSGFGTTFEYPARAAILFEDWAPVMSKDEKAWVLLANYHAQTATPEAQAKYQRRRWDEMYGSSHCGKCNPVPPTEMHYIAMVAQGAYDLERRVEVEAEEVPKEIPF